jgi:hypothetical protein
MQEEQLDTLILKNLEKVDHTFYSRLYGEGIFDVQLYNEFAIAVVAENKQDISPEQRSKVALHLWELAWNIQSTLLHHFNTQDAFNISNAADIALNEFIEKLYYICNWFTYSKSMDIEFVLLEIKVR